MLASVGDEDIRREVLSTENILSRWSFEIIFFVERREIGKHATENSRNVSALSSFQRQKKQSLNVGDKSQYVPWQRCKKLFYPFKETGTQNVKPFRYCFCCWRSQSEKVNAVQTYDDSSCFKQQNTQVMSLHANKRILLNKIFLDKKNLRLAKTLDHPRASTKISQYGTNKYVMVSALADTGAQ